MGEPDDDELPARLAELAHRLADVRSSELYTYLRISDRVQMRTLYQRISFWVRDEGRDIEQARRIWEDLAAFVNLLVEVNNRQELQDHDRRIIGSAYYALYANIRRPKSIPAALLEELKALEGLDEELDRLILHGSTRRSEDWQAPIRRLWERVEVAASEVPLSRPVSGGE